MYKPLALFTVGCYLLIATGNGLSNGAVQYDHLNLAGDIFNMIKLTTKETSFGIAPFGLGSLLTAMTEQRLKWRTVQYANGSNVYLMEYTEPLGTNKSIAEIMRKDFKDVELQHFIKFYISKGSEYASRVPQTDTRFPVDFRVVNYSQPDATNRLTDDIRFVSDDRIMNPFANNAIPPNMGLIFMNVWIFKGKFKKGFQESLFRYEFYRNGPSIGQVPFLYLHDELKYVHSPEMQSTIVEIPYKTQDFSMIAIFPDLYIERSGTKLNLPKVWRLLDRTNKRDVLLRLPKFEIESTYDLESPLIQVRLLQSVTWSKLSESSSETFISTTAVKQTISFAVEAEASIAHQPIYSVWKTSPVLKFNRPFWIVVRYKELALIIAEINDPLRKVFQW